MTVISRRKFLNTSTGNFLIGVVGAVGGVIARIAPSHGQSSAPERSLTRDEWMARWMRAPKKPEGTLHLSRFRDPMYFLTRPISWKPNPDQSGKIFHRRSTDRICDRFCQHSACFLVSIATGWRLHVSGDHSRLSVLDAARFERGCRRDPEAGHGGFRNRSRDHHDYLYSRATVRALRLERECKSEGGRRKAHPVTIPNRSARALEGLEGEGRRVRRCMMRKLRG